MVNRSWAPPTVEVTERDVAEALDRVYIDYVDAYAVLSTDLADHFGFNDPTLRYRAVVPTSHPDLRQEGLHSGRFTMRSHISTSRALGALVRLPRAPDGRRLNYINFDHGTKRWQAEPSERRHGFSINGYPVLYPLRYRDGILPAATTTEPAYDSVSEVAYTTSPALVVQRLKQAGDAIIMAWSGEASAVQVVEADAAYPEWRPLR